MTDARIRLTLTVENPDNEEDPKGFSVECRSRVLEHSLEYVEPEIELLFDNLLKGFKRMWHTRLKEQFEREWMND